MSARVRVCAFAGYGALLYFVAQLFAQRVNEAYMDEIFHVPQAQAYCNGQWRHWDDKITTFPGLYIVAVGFDALAARAIGNGYAGCNLTALRAVNLMFSFATVLLLERWMLARQASSSAGRKRDHGAVAAPWLRSDRVT